MTVAVLVPLLVRVAVHVTEGVVGAVDVPVVVGVCDAVLLAVVVAVQTGGHSKQRDRHAQGVHITHS